MIVNHVLSIEEIVLVAHFTLAKPNIMQKLDRINMIIQLKVQNDQNTLKGTSTSVLYGMTFQMLQKMMTRKNLEASYIALRKPDLNEQKKTLKD